MIVNIPSYTCPTHTHTVLATCHQPSPAQLSLAQLGPFDTSPLETKVFSKRIRTQNVIDPNPRRRGGRGRGRRQQKGATCHLPHAAQAANCTAICGNLLICCCHCCFLSLSQLLHFPAISFSPLCHFFTSLPLLPASLCLFFLPLSATSRFLRSQLGFVAKNKQQHSQIFG